MLLRIRKHFLTLILVLSICACSRTAIPTTRTYESTEDLLTALEKAGAEIVALDQDAQLLDVASREILINGEQAEIYEFENTDDREQGVLQLQTILDEVWPNGFDEFQSIRIWSHERLTVVYFGRDGGTVLLLSGLLGDPLQKPALAEDEPFPPAVPAAIQTLAEANEVDPSTIEVLSYNFHEWGDGCLGYPHPGEICVQVMTPGWRILLRLGEQIIEIHSDEMGGEIRWR